MNFSLDYIELHLDAAFVEIGMRLLEKHALIYLHEAEKDIFLAHIQQGKTYEIEIKLSNNRIQHTFCNCATFKENAACAHVAAVLLQLRTQKQANSTKTSSAKVKKENNKVTVNSILNSISPEQLRHFVRTYARSNRSFAVHLKTKFAPYVDVENGLEKYTQVLQSAILIQKNTKGTYTPKALQQILKMANQMIAQAEDLIALHNYTEALCILEACLLKISPLLRFSDQGQDNENFIIRILQTIWGIYNRDVAPVLKERVWKFMHREAFKSFYFNEHLEKHFLAFLQQIVHDNDKMSVLIVSAKTYLLRTDLHTSNQIHLIAFLLALYEKTGDTTAAEQLIQQHIDEDEIFVLAVEDAVQKQAFTRAKHLVASRPQAIKNQHLRQKIHESLFQMATIEKDLTAIQTYGIQRFLQSYNFTYIYTITTFIEDKDVVYDEILQGIQKQPYSVQKRDAIAQIHYERGHIETLFDYFQRIRSLDLLQRFDERLLHSYKKEIYVLYENLLFEYAKNHIGRKASFKIKKTIQHLREIGARDLVDKLVSYFRTHYAERHSLMEELQLF